MRTYLSQHIRLDPLVAYPVIVESMVSERNGKQVRCDLMATIVMFLSGGGLGAKINSVSNPRNNINLFRQLDAFGGKGAVLEVSWIHQSASSDVILCNGIRKVGLGYLKNQVLRHYQALCFATPEEAHLLLAEVLFSLKIACKPLGEDMDDTMDMLLRKARESLQPDLTSTPSAMLNTKKWLRLCELILSPVISPVYSDQTDSTLPRTNPLPFLKMLITWVLPANLWKRYTTEAQCELLRLIGVVLRASRDIASSNALASIIPATGDSRMQVTNLVQHLFSVRFFLTSMYIAYASI